MRQLLTILSIFIVCLASVSAKAQSTVQNFQSDKTIHAAGLDTVVNTASVSQILKVPGKLTTLTFMAGVTKLSGTPTTGFSAKLYGSNNNVRWDLATVSTDTLAVGNVTPEQVKTWKFTSNPYLYYKIVYKGFGTQTSKVSANALLRP